MLNLRPFLAIPYKHKGRDYTGVDCLGFDIMFYRDVCGKRIPDLLEDYVPDWERNGRNYFVEHYHKYFELVSNPGVYDIVAFQNRQGVVYHTGILLGYGKFVHCCKDGVLVDSYLRPEWQKRINGFYRLVANEKAY